MGEPPFGGEEQRQVGHHRTNGEQGRHVAQGDHPEGPRPNRLARREVDGCQTLCCRRGRHPRSGTVSVGNLSHLGGRSGQESSQTEDRRPGHEPGPGCRPAPAHDVE